VTAEFTATNQTVDGDASSTAAPAALASGAAPAAPVPMVVVEPMAKGLWFLGGGTHNSLLIEFKDHTTLIEVPQSDARGLAVIAKARELVPDKPLTEVITTHHHFDHTGGVRAAIFKGLRVITRPETAAMLQEVSKRPHTLVPDALAKDPKPLMVEAVSADRVMTDGTMTVNLYLFADEHAQNMLYAYFPKERILWESDIYNQGFAVHPYAAGLMAELKKRNLKVDRIAPGHGKLATWAQFVKDEAAQHAENSTH
jgi:glyoxylase-like metal-dependent hydrolase (beta-lactamase superfamily II)